MDYNEYWYECVAQAFDDAGIVATNGHKEYIRKRPRWA